MLVYEITATVDDKLIAEYERYMIEEHIPDVLATAHFTTASISKGGNLYRISYHAATRENLDAYLVNDATRLRADFAGHFPAGVEVSREIFEIVGTFQQNVKSKWS